MRKLALLASVFGLVCLGAYAYAQVYTGPPNPTALVCAYNTVVPTPVAGSFFYVQCDSTGKLIVQ